MMAQAWVSALVLLLWLGSEAQSGAAQSGVASAVVGLEEASSGEERPEGLSLPQAISHALQHSPLLQSAEHAVESAEVNTKRARGGFLPRLDLREVYTRSNNPLVVFGSQLGQGRFSQDDFDVDRPNDPAPVNNFLTLLSLRQPLYTGGQTSRNFARARFSQQAQERGRDRHRQEVIFHVTTRYYDILRIQSRLAVIRSAEKTAQATVRFSQDRYETGLVVESDLLSAQVRLAQLQAQDIAAVNQLTLAQAALNDAMGLGLETEWRITGQLNPQPVLTSQLEALEEVALKSRPDYQQLAYEKHALE